jgi:hypothetical protein
MILWERPGRHRDLKSKPGFSGHFRARAPIFVQRTTWNRLLRAVLRRLPTLAARRGGPLRAVELASRGMRLIIDFAMGRASGSAQTMHAMTLQASSQSKAGCTGTGGIPIFHIDRASGGFHLTPAVRQTVPPVRSRAPPVAIETDQIGNFSARVDTPAHIQQRGLIQSIQLGLRRARSS